MPARGRAGRARRLDRHGRGQRRAHVPGAGRRPRRRLARPLRLLPLHHRGAAAALRRDDHAGRRTRSRAVARGAQAGRALRLHRDAGQPDPGADRHPRRRRPRARRRRALHRRQRVRDTGAAEAAPARRRHRRLLRDQAYRRPGPLPRRHRAGHRGLHQRRAVPVPEAHRPVAQPVQRLGHGEGAGDAGAARAPALRQREPSSPTSSPPIPRSAGCSIPAAPTSRNTRWRSGRCPAAARS